MRGLMCPNPSTIEGDDPTVEKNKYKQKRFGVDPETQICS